MEPAQLRLTRGARAPSQPLDWVMPKLRDVFIASDPERARLRAAIRAWLTAAIGAPVLLGLAHLLGQPATTALIGVVVPLMSAVTLQESVSAQQRTSLFLMPLVAAPAVWLGAWLHDRPLAAASVFLLVIAAGIEARRFGPRGAGLGTMAYSAYFYALLLKPQRGSELAVLGFLLVGTACAYVARHFTRDRPERQLRDALRAWRARLSVLVDALVHRQQGGARERADARVHRQVAAMNAQSLALDGRLTALGAPASMLRDRLLEDELAAEVLASSITSDAAGGWLPGLRVLQATLHDGTPGRTGPLPKNRGEGAEDAGLQWRLHRALCVLTTEPAWALPPPPASAPVRTPSPSDGSAATSARRRWFSLDEPTRQAAQATAAAGAAALAGYAISADHWFWAVFASFVVFTRASSVGQAASQARQGMLANVAGVAFGLLLADLCSGHHVLQLALLYVFIGLGFYAYGRFQAVYAALLVAMLAMLYELLSLDTSGLLVLRLQEALAGSAIALACSALVFPVRTEDHSDRESAALLHKGSQVLHDLFHLEPPLPARETVRSLDRELGALRGALQPVTHAAGSAGRGHHDRRLERLTRLAYCLRHFYALVSANLADLRGDGALRARASGLAQELDDAARELQGEAAARPMPAMAGDAAKGTEVRLRLAHHWLDQVGEIVRDLRSGARPANPPPGRT
jgi:uncharacterized membrane protein YgaE (UPF0421/DUF939 family)